MSRSPTGKQPGKRAPSVGDKRWMKIWVKIVDPLAPQQIRHFTPEEAEDA